MAHSWGTSQYDNLGIEISCLVVLMVDFSMLWICIWYLSMLLIETDHTEHGITDSQKGTNRTPGKSCPKQISKLRAIRSEEI
ncbi:hypothetical protein BDV40DRAFT_254703 [Aspergillus tamarii]|uniref:Uncharacterized protein n=1 Tax=Aspergillus tamarii TaxID=41984 RepID=A0A5N6V7R4_ASPTM|nr:hypothetical protein BDV40DRAFT_254703 [Aspergillus tamarii]